jgi:hypothetical protein
MTLLLRKIEVNNNNTRLARMLHSIVGEQANDGVTHNYMT